MSKFTNLDIDFDKEIAPLLKEVKKATSNYTREIVRFVIASALIVLVSYLLILYQGLPQKTIIYACLPIAFFALMTFIHKQKNNENILKAHSLDVILEKLNYTWGVSVIDDELIQDSKLFPKYDYSESDDEFIGFEEGFFIAVSELTLTSHTSVNAGDRYIDFSGLVLLYIFEEIQIEAEILLKPKKLLKLFTTPKGFEKLETKLNVSNKDFEFYTNDMQKAEEFLTPKLLEKLAKVQEYFSFSDVSCCIKGNYCLVALHTEQDYFKLTSFELEEFKNEFNILLKELQNIRDFGKELKEGFKPQLQ
ncbi:DUF3137 domain-containing protein [Helicobacter trogontum]|uniref:DUF3137 domain-containing protein n=1 Tax=Helicobacter trogontum TaxID=50960 RepID=UPI002A91E961|nr:DUF3137 domain-containing protein [Helicobacter trogontum]MDY5184403.1 DUF3137 domain-containing protein [Helicobacter trogontum]